jgi:4-hydroxybenzoate polyprenyltransferase
MTKTIRTWLQLFRAPNLFTVPGDPLAGYVLAAYGAFESSAWVAVGASLCFYAAGLLSNDLADLAEDRAERPQRPLPSGAASPRTVSMVALLLTLAGLGLAASLGPTALIVGLALVVSIALYNHRTKRLPVIGALNMGLCRGLSLLLGAAAAPHHELLWPLLTAGRMNYVLVAFGLVTLYIAAVTHLARFETRAGTSVVARWLPMLVLVVLAPCFLHYVSPETAQTSVSLLGLFEGSVSERVMEATTFDLSSRRLSGILFLIAMVGALRVALHLTIVRDAPVPPTIGRLIRNLLLIQAALCTACITVILTVPEALNITAFLLLLWPPSRSASKKFYAS